MRARLVAAAATALILGACGTEPGGPPQFGADGSNGGEDADLAALAQQAEDVGIRDCPDPADSSSGPASGGSAHSDLDALPDLDLVCLRDGEPVNLTDLKGPAVINLWASWCKPCREELPLLATLDDEAGEQVQVIGIDVADKAPDAALELASRSGVTYPQLFDPDQLSRAPLGVQGLPQTVFVDEDGIMVATERTPYRSYEDLLDDVERHLGVRP